VARIFEAKRRPYFDPLIVHVGCVKKIEKVVSEVPAGARRLIDRFWPGPLTVVLPKKTAVPDLVTAGLPSVAVRMPDHPLALSLIEAAGLPIAAPSANPFGYLSPTTAEHVREQLGEEVDLILDGGPCRIGVESTILSFLEEPPRLLRPGGLPLEEIEAILGPVEIGPLKENAPSSPGRLPQHYAPKTPILVGEWEKSIKRYEDKKIGLLAFRERDASFPFQSVERLTAKGDLREAAANLFSALRRLDAAGVDIILAEPVPEEGLGRAIMDRLRRAGGSG
jgi:L-threonylcarbamoyladenylate synthase